MRTTLAPKRGEVWQVDLDTIKGHEQAGTRPAVVISADLFNAGPADMLIVCPITSKGPGLRSHVPVLPPEGGLSRNSYVLTEQVRAISKERLLRLLGSITPQTLREIEDRLLVLLGF